jgi:hypothetical protein
MLYIGFGDGGSGDDPNRQAQTHDLLFGKILRIDPNGTDHGVGGVGYGIPAGNLCGRSQLRARDLVAGPAQSLALLVRPLDRRPVDRVTSARARVRRSTAASRQQQ